MFYSQFILAKKGPLGTIWIAAHLERKLRKNQVADTDIGVSVDSIIFPEVPIALRLSSHLLLGVVRIYSRKVNYLFDDCSEALLKVKQAFRSTAVDLPPEESTAPYHSITLPETFDLDDFELPENEMFQGNYVDHHVSAREQITLQDTMDGVVYSTSQFGPDERFGDGGTCEINLDLDEEAFLQKVEETEHGESHNAFASPHPITPKEEEEDEFERSNALKSVLDDTSDEQVEPTTVDSVPHEYAEAPATPGLVNEANLSSVTEALNSDNHLAASVEGMHTEDSAEEIGIVQTNGEGTSQPFINEHTLANGDGSTSLTLKILSEPATTSYAKGTSPNVLMDYFNPAEARKYADNLQEWVVPIDSPDKALKPAILENEASDELIDLQSSNLHNVIQEDDSGKQVLHAKVTNVVLGANGIRPDLDDNPMAEPLLSENKDNVTMPTGPSKDVQSTLTSGAPPTETMLAAVGESADELNTLLEKEFLEDPGGNAKMTNISGKKRSLTESTLTEESSEMSFSKRTLESVPDDDDFLSSILVGKRSLALKLKPSPAPSEQTFSKRQRITQHVTAHKRKVLVDDSMVLHGDAIRQQLTNTEDLRRIRKKAPCTLLEISSIQRQFLGDEIFSEPIFTGFSLELHNLHKGSYDLSHTRVLEPAETITSAVGVDSQHEPIEIGPSYETQFIGGELVPELTETVSCSEPKQGEDPGLVSLNGIPEELNYQEERVDNVNEMELETEKVDTDVLNDATVLRPETSTLPSVMPEDAESYAGSCAKKLDSVVHEGACACISAVHPKPTTSDTQSSENDSSKGGLMMEKGPNGAEENVLRVDPRVESTLQMGEEASVGGDGFRERYGSTVEKACCFPANGIQGDIHNHGYQLLEQNVQEMYNQSPIEFRVDFDHSLVRNGHIGYEESTCYFDPQCSRDGEIPSVGNSAVNLYTDFDDTMAMNDTEFLNMDDDDEVADDGTVDDVDPQLLENRGWSVRTRGVAKYLQSLFQKERLTEVQGRKVVVMDNLVAGKTRKEASRLFFESLVLQTRDYIHIEQRQPYDSVIVTPRSVLLKSEF